MNYLVSELKVVGTRPVRPEGVDKVTGRAVFAADTRAPGLLWGKIMRSPQPHARITAIGTSKAEALPAVKAVLTAADCANIPSEQAFVGGRHRRRIRRSRCCAGRWIPPGEEVYLSDKLTEIAIGCCYRPRSTPPADAGRDGYRARARSLRVPTGGRGDLRLNETRCAGPLPTSWRTQARHDVNSPTLPCFL